MHSAVVGLSVIGLGLAVLGYAALCAVLLGLPQERLMPKQRRLVLAVERRGRLDALAEQLRAAGRSGVR